jgi:maltokinase
MSSSAHADLRSRIEAGDLHFLDGLVLLGTIASQRWFGGKSRDVLDARVLDAVVAPGGPPILAFAIVAVRYGLQSHDLYHLPLGFRPTGDAWNESVIAETEGWTVYDAIADPALIREVVSLMRSGTTLHFDDSRMTFWGANGLADRTGELRSIRPMGIDQSNSSVIIDESVALKFYRRIEPGVNPELEALRFLTEREFPHVAALEGYVAYEGRPLETTLALLQRYIPSRGDAWQLALDTIESDPNWLPAHAARLGEVTALLHNALGVDATDPHFAPEEPSSEALSLLSASVDEEIEYVFTTLPNIEPVAPIAGRGEEVRDRLRLLTHIGSVGKVIRTHWLILDFEGEPARSVPERRRKRSPLRDVAGMLRSFAYAASASRLQRGIEPPAGWEENCRTNFLDGYLTTADPALLPVGEQAIERLLMVFELEKAVYELRYELDNRPDWVGIPVAGILRMLEAEF